jgi:hypothetical protein
MIDIFRSDALESSPKPLRMNMKMKHERSYLMLYCAKVCVIRYISFRNDDCIASQYISTLVFQFGSRGAVITIRENCSNLICLIIISLNYFKCHL